MKPFFRIEIEEGQQPPRGYGLTYRLPYKRAGIFHPFPFNHIIGAVRDFYYRVVDRRKPEEEKFVQQVKTDIECLTRIAQANSGSLEKVANILERILPEDKDEPKDG